jgi:hypothetical protein
VNKFPGPQSYNINPLINGKGNIFVSKFKSSLGKTIAGKHEFKADSSSNIYLNNFQALDPEHTEVFRNLEFMNLNMQINQ